jgi:hypothetical protein
MELMEPMEPMAPMELVAVNQVTVTIRTQSVMEVQLEMAGVILAPLELMWTIAAAILVRMEQQELQEQIFEWEAMEEVGLREVQRGMLVAQEEMVAMEAVVVLEAQVVERQVQVEVVAEQIVIEMVVPGIMVQQELWE